MVAGAGVGVGLDGTAAVQGLLREQRPGERERRVLGRYVYRGCAGRQEGLGLRRRGQQGGGGLAEQVYVIAHGDESARPAGGRLSRTGCRGLRFHLGVSGTLCTQEPLSRACAARGFRRVKGVKIMPAIVLIGAQWGDEGKGKATDLLGDRVQYVVRYQGGNNAGHTVVHRG